MNGLTTTQEPPWIGGVAPASELLGATGTQILELECREQPGRLCQLLDAYQNDPVVRAELKTFREFAAKPGAVQFAGMGASFCSGIAGSTLLQTHERMSFTVDAGEWLHYARSLDKDIAALTVLLTTSGESAEIVELMRSRADQPLGLLCNNTASTCWKLGRIKLPILAGPENGNATKPYTNATTATIILASEMMGVPSGGGLGSKRSDAATEGSVGIPVAGLVHCRAGGGILYGFDMGVIAAALIYVRESFGLSTVMQELVSVVLIGAMAGALGGGVIADKIGRRATLLWGSVLFLAGSVLAFAAPGVILLIVARALLGIAIGFTSVTAPVYVSELAPPQSRGMLIGLYQFALTVGKRRPTWWNIGSHPNMAGG